jgi:hypothetical protein
MDNLNNNSKISNKILLLNRFNNKIINKPNHNNHQIQHSKKQLINKKLSKLFNQLHPNNFRKSNNNLYYDNANAIITKNIIIFYNKTLNINYLIIDIFYILNYLYQFKLIKVHAIRKAHAYRFNDKTYKVLLY